MSIETRCVSGDRDMVIRVLTEELRQQVVYQGAPQFTCSVGGYSLLRDGRIIAEEDERHLFPLLASMGLCNCPVFISDPGEKEIWFPMEGHSGTSLINLFCIISARQFLLNQALAAKGAFSVDAGMMRELLEHPPQTVPGFLQALYGKEGRYRGIRITAAHITFTGFAKAPVEESHIHRQLAERMIRASLDRLWTKPFTRNVRNRKYAFRVWMNALGMTGPEYEEARRVLLARLPGKADRRKIPTRTGKSSDFDKMNNNSSSSNSDIEMSGITSDVADKAITGSEANPGPANLCERG